MRRGFLIPPFRFNRAPYGTVYLMQSRSQPRLFKVGYTTRRTKDRRSELNRVAGDDMAIVATVQLPWARACETLLLRRLRFNPLRRGDRRGTEWFWLGRREDISKIEIEMERTAKAIRRMAWLRLSWPSGASIKTFRAGVER